MKYLRFLEPSVVSTLFEFEVFNIPSQFRHLFGFLHFVHSALFAIYVYILRFRCLLHLVTDLRVAVVYTPAVGVLYFAFYILTDSALWLAF